MLAIVLPDYLAPNLDAVFVGTSVAAASARRGHYYAGPGNKFWQFLCTAGLTDRILRPEEEAALVAYGIGLTDLVKGRFSSSDSLLRSTDHDVGGFLKKMR